MNMEILSAILNSMPEPVVFVDMEHVIRYMNKAAVERYKKRGQTDLVGNSILACHKTEKSRQFMIETLQMFVDGENERYISVTVDGYKVYMRAVRDPEGSVIGYYERFEKA